MGNHRQDVNEIVARCRRIGWKVEAGDEKGNSEWLFRILPPAPHKPVQIHGSPSDINWKRTVMRDLRRAGFDAAEKDWLAAEEVKRRRTLAADQAKAARKADELAAHAAAVARAAGPLSGPQPVDMAWLTTPTPFKQTVDVIMTPEAAARVLAEMNTHNRPRSASRVRYFMGLMERGAFALTHQGVSIDTRGILQDGQSRLEAIRETGIAVPLAVTVGAPPDNFTKVDTGGVRSARDTAYVLGEDDPATSSAAARMLWFLDQYGSESYVKARSSRVPNDVIGEAITAYGDRLRGAIKQAADIKRGLKAANKTSLAVAIYLIAGRMPRNDPRVARFFDDILYGLDGRRFARDPVYRLRKTLADGPSDARRNGDAKRRGYDAWEQVALIVKAWNFRAIGEQKQNVVWRRDHPFPTSPVLPPPIDEDEAWAALKSRTAS